MQFFRNLQENSERWKANKLSTSRLVS